jgi:hypothetical protein
LHSENPRDFSNKFRRPRDRLTFQDWRPAADSGEMFDAIAQPARRHEDWLNLSADF